jgi:hypothetical protein
MDSQIRRTVAGRDAALLRGALVLLCSHLEGFFEELIEDALHAFDLLAPTVAAIPLAIRQKQVTYRLRLAEPADLDRDWRRLLECVAHPLLQDDHPCLPGTRKIDSELHIKGFANPGTGEIDWLMASIGVSECWARRQKARRQTRRGHGQCRCQPAQPDSAWKSRIVGRAIGC